MCIYLWWDEEILNVLESLNKSEVSLGQLFPHQIINNVYQWVRLGGFVSEFLLITQNSIWQNGILWVYLGCCHQGCNGEKVLYGQG